MLLYLSCWMVLGISAASVGTAILCLTKSTVFPHLGDRIITAIWLGLLTIASALLALSIMVPLSSVIGFLLIAVITAVAISIGSVRGELKRSLASLENLGGLILVLVATVAAWDAAGLVEAYDTGLYHYQLTSWLSQYGTIPGLALIHHELGLSSAWFALAAPFDFGPFRGRISGLLDGFVIFLSLAHFALALVRVLQRRANRADWFLLGGYGLIFPVCFAWAFEVSLSPDVPIWILTLLTSWLMVSSTSDGLDRAAGPNPILPLVLASCATAVKFSALPVLMVAALFYWLHSSQRWSTRVVCGIAAGLIALPVFAANTVSSGYPLYPNPVLRLNVPWGMEKADAQEFAVGIMNWARWGGFPPEGATKYNWIVPWFLHADKLLLLGFCGACLLGFLIFRGWKEQKTFLYVLGLALFGTAFVFANAPNPRFGLGYLALYPALFLGTIGPGVGEALYQRIFTSYSLRGQTAVACVAVTLAVFVIATGSLREFALIRKVSRTSNLGMPANSGFVSRLILPPALPSFPGDLAIVKNRSFDGLRQLELITDRTNGIEYQHPLKGDQCWAAALPCTSTSLTGDVHLRRPDNGFRSGFAR